MEDLSLIDSLLSLPGIKVDKMELSDRKIELYCHCLESDPTCPRCGNREDKSVVRYYSRKIRDLNISGREVWLFLEVRQYRCSCGHHFHEPLDFVEPGKSYTKRQAKFIFECCDCQPFKEVAAIHNMSVQTVRRIYYSYARAVERIAHRYAEVRHLGIDELAFRKGRRSYCCVLVDLERGRQLDILPDNKKETLLAHFERLGKAFRDQVVEVCADMYKVYHEVFSSCFPNARVTLDRFHIVQLLNKPLDAIRRKLKKQYPKEEAFRRIKWTLFKVPWRLDPQQKRALHLAFERAPALKTAYVLRNQFHAILDQAQSKEQAEILFTHWRTRVGKSNQEEWLPFLRTSKYWKDQILNFVESRVSNASTEGLNNLIRYIQRISFGMTNFENLRTRVLTKQDF